MKWLLTKLISGYQRFISPARPATCRYHPTCSQYALDALKQHGALKGSLMAVARILRCHPFVKGGIDYVSLKFTLRRNTNQNYPGPYPQKKK